MNAISYALMATISMTLSKSFVKQLDAIPVEQIIFFRMIFAFAVSLPFLLRDKPNWKKLPYKVLVLRGISGTLGLFLLLTLVKSARFDTAIALHHLTPIFSIIFAALILKESVSFKTLSPLAFTLLGLYFLQTKGFSIDPYTLAIALTSCLFASLAYICIRYLKQRVSTHLIILALPTICLPLMAPFTYIKWQTPSLTQWLFIFLTAFSAWIGQIGLTKAYQMEKTSKVAPINYMSIPFSILLSHFVFLEFVNISQLFSISLIVLGVFLTQVFQNRLKN